MQFCVQISVSEISEGQDGDSIVKGDSDTNETFDDDGERDVEGSEEKESDSESNSESSSETDEGDNVVPRPDKFGKDKVSIQFIEEMLQAE